ncbi:MAG: hypothetical protein Q9207_007218 [Kuettlingeria erythrocarpa]
MPTSPRHTPLLLLALSFFQRSVAVPAAQSGYAWRSGGVVVASSSIRGPVIDGNFADPSILKADGAYFAYATNQNGVRCPVASSFKFEHWAPVTGNDVLPNLPAWAATGKGESVWGPDVTQIAKEQYVMYITAVTKDAYDHRCIGAATSNDPISPFKPANEPLICPPKSGDVITNVIGGAAFHDPSSPAGQSRYLLYCERVLTPGTIAQTRTMAQPVSPDGLTTSGAAFPMTVADASEGYVNESPSVVYADGIFILFFSTHAWYDPAYTVSCATAKAMEGPWTKQKEPVLKTGMPALKGWTSPGSGTVLSGETDEVQGGGAKVKYVFHATEPGTEGNGHGGIVRSLWTATFLVKDGRVKAV